MQLSEHPELDAADLLGALYDEIPYIAQRMSFNRFRLFLLDECHSLLRLEPPSRRQGVRRWRVLTHPKPPPVGHLSESEQRLLRLNAKIVHCIAQFPHHGLRLHEIVGAFEQETGTAFPADIRLREHMHALMNLKLVTVQQSNLGNHSYSVPPPVRLGIFLKRLLSRFPDGLPFTQLAAAWVDLEFADRVQRGKRVVAKERIQAPAGMVGDVDHLFSNFYAFAHVRHAGGADPAHFDVRRVTLLPKLQPSAMAWTKRLNRKGQMRGFDVMQMEDKLDWVLQRYASADKGMPLCAFIEKYEAVMGTQLPFTNGWIFDFLAQYKVPFELAEPALLSRVFPTRFRLRLRDALAAHGRGIADSELDRVWRELYGEDLCVEPRQSAVGDHRALALYDRHYAFLRVSVDAETREVRYHLREQLEEDAQAQAQGVDFEHEREPQWVRIIRFALYRHQKQHDNANLRFIDFVDYFEATYWRPFPRTRALSRVLRNCAIEFATADEVDGVVCLLQMQGFRF